jgi:hypothetical protein
MLDGTFCKNESEGQMKVCPFLFIMRKKMGLSLMLEFTYGKY